MPEHTPAPTPSRSVYGFVLFLCSKASFILFLIWAIVPEEWFEEFNITYLPQRYWAVAIPIFLLTVTATFGLVIYPSLSLCMTPNIDDIRTVVDKVTKENKKGKLNLVRNREDEENMYNTECICKVHETCQKHEFIVMHKQSSKCNISMVEDLCIADVSRSLYLK